MKKMLPWTYLTLAIVCAVAAWVTPLPAAGFFAFGAFCWIISWRFCDFSE
jgi:hypothetical protein